MCGCVCDIQEADCNNIWHALKSWLAETKAKELNIAMISYNISVLSPPPASYNIMCNYIIILFTANEVPLQKDCSWGWNTFLQKELEITFLIFNTCPQLLEHNYSFFGVLDCRRAISP